MLTSLPKVYLALNDDFASSHLNLENILLETCIFFFFFKDIVSHTFNYRLTVLCTTESNNSTHTILLNLLHAKIPRFFFPDFSWHGTRAGEWVSLRIRCYGSLELNIIHRSTAPTVHFGPPGSGGAEHKQCSKWDAMAGFLQTSILTAVEGIFIG